MASKTEKRLMSALPAGEFFGRRREYDEMMLHAWSTGGLRVLSPPGGGSSELLKQVSDALFFDSSEIIPFYFAFRASDESARNTTTRFLQEFLLQMISYRRRDPSIYLSSPEVCELSDLTTGGDAAWFTELIRNCDIQSPAKDDRSFVRNCLSAPLRVAGHGTRILVMLDDIHECASLADSSMLVSELVNIFSRNNIAFVVSGRRRFAVPGLPLRELELDDLNGTAAHDLVKQFADSLGVLINDQTRDLIAAQTSG